jgi:hypothetical protein
MTFLPHLLPDRLDRLLGEALHRPRPGELADVEEERPIDVLAPRGVDHLGVELEPVDRPLAVRGGGERGV